MSKLALASGLVSVLAPLLHQSVGKSMERASAAGWRERAEIWERVKDTLQGDVKIIGIFESNPDSKEVQDMVTIELEKKLRASPQAAKDLARMLEDLPRQIQNNIEIEVQRQELQAQQKLEALRQMREN